MSAHPYLPHTDPDIAAMTASMGIDSVDRLFDDVDPSLRLKKPYDLPQAMSEIEIRRYFEHLRSLNRPLTCFAGAGAYDHYTPAVIAALTSRSEFLTAYTPYQPEISQGTLQYIFEYQSMMCSLTGLDVSNASMYDGATATAEAMMMAVNAARRKRRVLISATLNPAVAAVCATYARYHGITLDVIPERDGCTDSEAFGLMMQAGDVAGVIVGMPNYYGIVEDYTGWADTCHNAKALLIMNAPASPLAVLRTPASWGADIAVGDAQSLGMPLNYGGPYLGYMCCTKALMRKLPGRIVGATRDERGQRVFVLTLQAREQHIRREKATSNICSNQGLMALHTAIYLSLTGNDGLREVNRLSYGGAHALAEGLCATGKFSLTFPDKPYFNEVCLTAAPGVDIDAVLKAVLDQGILGGVKIAGDRLLVAATEMQSPADIDRYVSIVKNL